MNNTPILDDLPAALHDLIARFGRFHILIRLLLISTAQEAAKNSEIPDYLRRDLGLPPRPPDVRLWERHR